MRINLASSSAKTPSSSPPPEICADLAGKYPYYKHLGKCCLRLLHAGSNTYPSTST